MCILTDPFPLLSPELPSSSTFPDLAFYQTKPRILPFSYLHSVVWVTTYQVSHRVSGAGTPSCTMHQKHFCIIQHYHQIPNIVVMHMHTIFSLWLSGFTHNAASIHLVVCKQCRVTYGHVCVYIQYLCLCAPSSNIPHSVIQISLCLNLSPVYNQLKSSTTLPEHVFVWVYPVFFPYEFYLGFLPGGSSGTSLTVVDISYCKNYMHHYSWKPHVFQAVISSIIPSSHILISY